MAQDIGTASRCIDHMSFSYSVSNLPQKFKLVHWVRARHNKLTLGYLGARARADRTKNLQ